MTPDCIPCRKSASIAVLLVCASIMVFAVSFSGMPLNNDCALLLQCGRLISEGSVPFVDHVETNLHMAQYIHVPPVLLSSMLGIGVIPLFSVGVLVFTFCSCIAVFLLVRKSGVCGTWTGAALIASSVLILSMKSFMDGDFGQREHLFVLAWLPFLFVRFSRCRGIDVNTPLALATGVFAGILMLCKPTFLALVVLIETWMRIRMGGKRNYIRSEMLAVYSVLLLFAVHLLILPGSLQSPFFTRWIPFISSGYHAYNESFYTMIRGNLRFWPLFFMSVVLAVYTMNKSRSAIRHLLELILAALVLAIGLFFLQHKGWLYHLFPAYGLVILLLSAAIAALYEKYRSREANGKPIDFALLLSPVIVCLVMGAFSFRSADHRYSDMSEFMKVIDIYSDPGERISVISTCVYPKYPTLVYADRLTGTRFLSSFPIALVYSDAAPADSAGFSYRLPGDWTEEEREFLAELGSDILTNRPALVFIDTSPACQACPPGFRIDEYLTASGWVDEYLSDYELLFTLNGFRTYQLN